MTSNDIELHRPLAEYFRKLGWTCETDSFKTFGDYSSEITHVWELTPPNPNEEGTDTLEFDNSFSMGDVWVAYAQNVVSREYGGKIDAAIRENTIKVYDKLARAYAKVLRGNKRAKVPTEVVIPEVRVKLVEKQKKQNSQKATHK